MKVRVVSGPQSGAEFTVAPTGSTLGRSRVADIHLEDGSLSRLHCRFYEEGGAAFVQDLGSSNGTSVNGVPAGSGAVALREGDVVAVEEPEAPTERASDVLYHADADKPGDERDFLSVAEYEKWAREKGLYRKGGKRIVVTGQMADPSGLIDTLEQLGYNVYPVLSLRRLMDFVEEIAPDAIVNMAHGRLGDRVVDYLREHNILLFAPLTVNSLVEEWEADPMGMSGGFLSQSVVTPEIDGAVRTAALFAQYEDGYEDYQILMRLTYEVNV